MTPLNAVTKPFINQLKSFNEYTETQKSHSNSFANNSFSKRGPKTGFQKHQKSMHDRSN